MQKLGLTPKRLIILGVAVLAFFLLMDLNTRLTELFRLSSDRDQLQTQVGEMKRTQSALNTQIAYSTSDKAVEDWARENGHLVVTGDIPIIPIGQDGATPTPIALPTAIPRQVQNWEVWYVLFFGQ